jgi:hypothetical protein
MARGEKKLGMDSLSSSSSRVGDSGQYAEQTPTVRELGTTRRQPHQAGQRETRGHICSTPVPARHALPVAAKCQSFHCHKARLVKTATHPRHPHRPQHPHNLVGRLTGADLASHDARLSRFPTWPAVPHVVCRRGRRRSSACLQLLSAGGGARNGGVLAESLDS